MFSIIAGDRPPIDADARLWASAVQANGGTVSFARRLKISTLIRSLKAGGNWALTDDLWLLVAENATQALTSLKQRRLATVTAAPTFTTDAGYAFNGTTQYIDTGFVPSTHSVVGSTNDNRIAGYERTNVNANTYLAGTNSGSNRTIGLRPRVTASVFTSNNSAAATFTLAVSDSRGYTSGSRNTADTTGVVAYKNAVAMTRAADPAGFGASLPSHSLYIGAQNNSGTAATFRASTIGLVLVGATLTQAQETAEYNAVQAFMTAVGAQV